MAKSNFIKLSISNDKGEAITEVIAQGRTFKSGKTGYGYYGKVEFPKTSYPFLTIKFVDDKDAALTQATAQHREFSSGKKGYGVYDKIQCNGDRLQTSINIIQVNSDKDDTEKRHQFSVNLIKIEPKK